MDWSSRDLREWPFVDVLWRRLTASCFEPRTKPHAFTFAYPNPHAHPATIGYPAIGLFR